MHPVKRFLQRISVAILFIALPAYALAQQAPPAEGDEAALIAVLESDVPLFDKAKACQQLAVIGTKNAVPTLAKLLPDEQLSHYARFGLEPIPDPSVDEALRDATSKLKGGLLVGVINSIGMRRDVKAVDDLKKLIGDSDPAVAAAAASALGRIATPEAIAILRNALGGPESLRPAVADALLTAADALLADGKQAEAAAIYDALRKADLPKHLQIAALYGVIRADGSEGMSLLAECLGSEDKAMVRVALRMAQEINSPDVAQTIIEALELPEKEQFSLDGSMAQHPRQVLLIYTLGDLGQSAALPVILKAAESNAQDIRQAAIQVLGKLGDASAVGILLSAMEDEGGLSQAAFSSLIKLKGDEVDAAIAKALDGAEGGTRVLLIQLVGERGISSALPALKQAANDADPQVAVAAIRALGTTIGSDDLSILIGRLVKPRSPDEATAVNDALKKALLRMPDREAAAAKLLAAVPQASGETRLVLLDLLGVVGGQTALKGVAAAVKEGSDELQDAATRVLGGWMTPDAAPVLLELAKTGSDKYKVRTLRGYIRIIRQFGLPDDQRLAMCREALQAASRDQERQLVLDALTRIPSPAAMEMIAPYLDNLGLKKAASAAAVSLGEKIVDQYPVIVADAMKKAQTTSDKNVADRATLLLRRADAKLP
jgi:HEAT repeat protein